MNTISWWKTDYTEADIECVARALRNRHVSMGPVTAEFEKRICEKLGCSYAIATSSGSTALMLALMAAGIVPGDEVIVPNRTWIATAHAAHVLGATVVLVDVEKNRPIIDASQIERKITKRTKALMPVHLNGRSSDMRKINEIAKEYNIAVIEDAAQAFMSKNADGYLGCQSSIGCFSLSIAKLFSSGQGGFAVTNDPSLHEKMRSIRTHGVGDLINVRYTQPGLNFRLTDMQSALAMSVLERIDERISKVKAIYREYEEGMTGLSAVRLIKSNVAAGEIPIYIETLCEDRGATVKYLADVGIQTRPFYPDIDTAPHFAAADDFPNSRKYGTQGLFLPSGPDQASEDIKTVIKEITKLCRK